MDMGDGFEEFEELKREEDRWILQAMLFRQSYDEWKLTQGVKKTELLQKVVVAIRLLQEKGW